MMAQPDLRTVEEIEVATEAVKRNDRIYDATDLLRSFEAFTFRWLSAEEYNWKRVEIDGIRTSLIELVRP